MLIAFHSVMRRVAVKNILAYLNLSEEEFLEYF
jgi:hypothetical protein